MRKLYFTIVLLITMVLLTFCAKGGDSDLGDGVFARITTNRGDIVLRLEYERAPMTVMNFITLAEGKMEVAGGRPYYDGLVFHRVIDEFMIQTGDPQGTGMGGPGYRFPDEIVPGLRHDSPGILSMANSGPGTNGSQFFITHVPTPWLDGRHSVFGRVVQGQDVVDAIREGDRMNRVTIIRNGTQATEFRADQAVFESLVQNHLMEAAARNRVQREADIAQISRDYPDAQITESGIRYMIRSPGSGSKPNAGDEVAIRFVAMFLSGEIFDDSESWGEDLIFNAGANEIFPGLDETVMDMTAGEKRFVIIPPELAFGEVGVDGFIPPNSFIIFDLELVRIN